MATTIHRSIVKTRSFTSSGVRDERNPARSRGVCGAPGCSAA